MNLTIEQLSTLSKRVASKKYPARCGNTKRHTWRSERIIDRLVSMEENKRIEEGRYWNGL